MELKRFVRVVRDDGRHDGGTGYLLDGDRVLTARHVVEGAARLSIVYDGPTGEGVRSVPARELWKGEGDLDVAVLEVQTGLPLARQILQPVTWTAEDRPYRSRGWARAAGDPPEVETSVVASMSPLSGTAYQFVRNAHRFDLTVEAPPQGTEWLRGSSGAPVFCGEQLVGVIVIGESAFQGGRVSAVPVAALWEARGFRKTVGCDSSLDEQREERRKALRQDVAEILKQDPNATVAIAGEHPDWARFVQEGGGGAEALATALGESEWKTALAALERAHEKLCRRAGGMPSPSADVVVQVLERLLPVLYAVSSLHLSPGEPGGYMLTLPIETECFAELAMAAFDGRTLAYREADAPQRYPSGSALFRSDDAQHEEGFDFTGEEAFRRWVVHLARWLPLEERHVEAVGQPERFQQLVELVDFHIARETKRFGLPRRYFTYSGDFAAAHQPFLARLRESLPSLHLVELAGKSLLEEQMALDPLQAILYRSFQARSRTR